MCTLFVFTMICGVWQYAAIENTFYFEDRENIVSEEICEYAVTQRIAEHKRLNYNTNTRGIEPLLPLLSLLLGFLLYAPVVRKIHLCRLQNPHQAGRRDVYCDCGQHRRLRILTGNV